MIKTEEALINSVCDTKDISCVMEANVDEMFTGYPDAWQFIKEYYSKYRAVPDIKVVQEKFIELPTVEVSGDTPYILDKLREEFIQRRLEEVTEKVAANLGSMGSQEVLEKAMASLTKLQQYSTASKDVNIAEFDEAIEYYEEVRRRAEEMGGTPGIPTGIDFIDSSYTTGLSGGDLVVVLGWPARGKSLLTSLLACNAFDKGFKPMIVSLEMSAEKVRDRVYTIMGSGRFRNSKLSLGDLDVEDFKTFSKEKRERGSNFQIISHSGEQEITPAVIQSKINQYGSNFIILDYAQIMSDNARSNDMTARMRNLSRECKRLAVANDIPVILISSATPEGQASTESAPVLSAVAQSKAISFDADLAFAVHRLNAPSDVIEIVCRKNRNGDLFAGYLKADIDAGIYKEFIDLEEYPHL